MWALGFGSVLLSVIRVAVADDLFIYPTAPGPDNNFVADLAWSLGSVQNIQWTTTKDSYSIALFEQNVNNASAGQIQTIYSMFPPHARGFLS
jgi:hypothetical protein